MIAVDVAVFHAVINWGVYTHRSVAKLPLSYTFLFWSRDSLPISEWCQRHHSWGGREETTKPSTFLGIAS